MHSPHYSILMFTCSWNLKVISPLIHRRPSVLNNKITKMAKISPPSLHPCHSDFATPPTKGQRLFPVPINLLGFVTWQWNAMDMMAPVLTLGLERTCSLLLCFWNLQPPHEQGQASLQEKRNHVPRCPLCPNNQQHTHKWAQSKWWTHRVQS